MRKPAEPTGRGNGSAVAFHPRDGVPDGASHRYTTPGSPLASRHKHGVAC
jgi:hypothetical protein